VILFAIATSPSKDYLSDSGRPSMSTQKTWLGHGGSSVENKNEILNDVDRLLGVSKPPDLEILFGMSWFRCFRFDLLFSSYENVML
jgi:hypothetical protein